VKPPLRLDDDQRAILEAAVTAVVAVNREGHSPQLTTAEILWDGATLRFLTLGWSRRTTMLRADPHIGLLIDGPDDGRFVTVTGRARIADGRTVRDEAWPVLRKQAADDEEVAERLWTELLAADVDRAVVIVEPDQVLSGRR
jgi:nitroimidazol reductase NimA-like FMN-containing flavoprotein (pyridoxamine 5'-phosphate oxidase superfamily)